MDETPEDGAIEPLLDPDSAAAIAAILSLRNTDKTPDADDGDQPPEPEPWGDEGPSWL